MITRAALARLQPLTPVSVPAGELAALMDRAERSDADCRVCSVRAADENVVSGIPGSPDRQIDAQGRE